MIFQYYRLLSFGEQTRQIDLQSLSNFQQRVERRFEIAAFDMADPRSAQSCLFCQGFLGKPSPLALLSEDYQNLTDCLGMAVKFHTQDNIGLPQNRIRPYMAVNDLIDDPKGGKCNRLKIRSRTPEPGNNL